MNNDNDNNDTIDAEDLLSVIEIPSAPRIKAKFPASHATKVLFDPNDAIATGETEVIELRVTIAPRIRTSISLPVKTWRKLSKGLTDLDSIEATGTPVAKSTYQSRRGEEMLDIKVAWELDSLAPVRNKFVRGDALTPDDDPSFPVRDNRGNEKKTEKPGKNAGEGIRRLARLAGDTDNADPEDSDNADNADNADPEGATDANAADD